MNHLGCRCQNCGRWADRPHAVRFGRRLAYVCDRCLEAVVHGIVMVNRAVDRRYAA